MNFIDEILSYQPVNIQEETDKKVISDLINTYGQNLLNRENMAVHVSASGFIVNPTLTKTLVVYHNIYKAWTWTGGHADGDGNLLNVALREATEETGISKITEIVYHTQV